MRIKEYLKRLKPPFFNLCYNYRLKKICFNRPFYSYAEFKISKKDDFVILWLAYFEGAKK